jgi:hypothetical protein
VERIDASAEGRVEVEGRWFGVRGRRFVRPTLTLTHKGAGVRALADLEHKPWAAEDGEVWRAAFSVDEGLDGAREIELSVAPDIVVELRPKGKKLARPGDLLSAGQATPVPASASGLRGSLSHAAELERLGSRLAAASNDLEQERERRAVLAKTLEAERSTSRQLRTELGQARSELEVAAAARAEATAVEAELEDARRQLREIQRRHEDETASLARRHEQATQVTTHEHEQLTQAHAALQDELQQHAGALQSTQETLAAERAEAGRLREREAGREPATQRFDVFDLDDLGSGPAATAPSRSAGRRGTQQPPEQSAGSLPQPQRLRPLNPSLRHRTWWLGRLLALIVLLGVIAAVYMVLHSTVLH